MDVNRFLQQKNGGYVMEMTTLDTFQRLYSPTWPPLIKWGGGTPSPPMGSGYFPDLVFTHAYYFRHVAYQNASRMDHGAEYVRTSSFSDKGMLWC